MPSYQLKSAILKIKTKRLNFALYRGDKENQVLITAKPAKAKQVEEIEKEIGDAKRIAKGVCFWEGNKLIFATKNVPAPAWEMIIVKAFKQNECSKFLPVEMRQLGATESDEAEAPEDEAEDGSGDVPIAPPPSTEGGTVPPVTPPPPEGGGQVPPNAPPQPPVTGGGVPPVPPPPPGEGGTVPPVPPPTPGGDMEKFKARLAGIVPKIGAATAAGSPIAQDAKLKASEAAVFARKNDFAQADRLLDESEALLKNSGTGSTTTTPPTAPPLPADLKAQYEKQLAALEPRVADALKQQLGDTSKMRAVDAFTREKAAAGNYQSALQGLAGLEKLLAAAATTTAPPKTENEPTTPGNETKETEKEEEKEEEHEPAMPVWQDARDVVNGQLSKLQSKLRGTQDPEFIRIADFGLNGLTKRLQVGLQVALMDLDNAKGEQRDKARAKARAVLKEFDSFLDSDPMVSVLEENPFGVPVTLRSTLGKAIARITKSLSR